ncbi:MAG: hypothetical protein O7C75_12160 [Verrucomicrobia bacterium]|nr:hypothetical protein [Verrucomicrobiota bacterium]
MNRCITLSGILLPCLIVFADAAELEPQLVQLDQLIVGEDFTEQRDLEKENWHPRQHTRWAMEDGVLRGIPSTAVFQASQDHHQGLEARLSIPSCPDEFAIQFSLRFIGGEETSLCPFIEFGHHKARLYWSEQGARLLANKESVQLDFNASFKLESGTWYHALAEIKGDEIVIRFSHGAVFYGKHPSLVGKKDGFGVAGFQGGQVELDNIKVWSIKEDRGENWDTHVRRFNPTPHKILKPEVTQGS